MRRISQAAHRHVATMHAVPEVLVIFAVCLLSGCQKGVTDADVAAAAPVVSAPPTVTQPQPGGTATTSPGSGSLPAADPAPPAVTQPPPSGPRTTTPPPAAESPPAPASPPTTSPPTASPPEPSPSPASSPALSHWLAGGVEGKTICFVGDSTTSNATALFDQLEGKFGAEGEPLHGVGPILNFGENGASIYAFLANQVVHGITATIAADADLYVISYGINDVRLGNTSEDQLAAMLTDAVNKIRAAVPAADIVLRMPNSLLSQDINGYHYVNPNSSAQAYSTLLRNAYLRLDDQWPNVVVLDTQQLVFGTESLPTSLFMADQLHPSAVGYIMLADALVGAIAPPN